MRFRALHCATADLALADIVRDMKTGATLVSYRFSRSSIPAAGSIKLGLYRAVSLGMTDVNAYAGDFSFRRS